VDPAQAAGYATGTNDFFGRRHQSFFSHPNNVLSYDKHRIAGSSWYHKPRGSYKLTALYALGGANKVRPRITDNVVYATFRVTEPLLLSPFVFGHPEGKQGFYGIQTMNFQMNVAANASRAWRAAAFGNFTKTATVESFENSEFLFQFLTPHASDLLEPRNVVPFYELPIYRTSNFSTIPSIGFGKQQRERQCDGRSEQLEHPAELRARQARHLRLPSGQCAQLLRHRQLPDDQQNIHQLEQPGWYPQLHEPRDALQVIHTVGAFQPDLGRVLRADGALGQSLQQQLGPDWTLHWGGR
jgi:hypothetical protein